MKITLFFIISFVGATMCNPCHVDGEKSLHCGEAENMHCKTADYTPYCHQISNNTGMNGQCTCEKLCFVDGQCAATGCPPRMTARCTEAFSNSIERFCICN
ncbi:uncharacterized protein LOC128205251 [Mya arenaria]|uniref:uncharacterized protein LOC128205251 n=1 Tax=Mya arenaria TaxID=6604 RepID=UPI0022E55BFC|nr:uncharacterized protein LOC128205251 [Mya arenaria]